MLRELTKCHPALWVRIVDADGEFLLIEAAKVLPEWLSPSMDQHRVWVHNGKLFIIPLEDDGMHESQKSLKKSLSQAVGFIRSKPDRLVHSPLIQTEAFYRLGKYPGQIADSAHNSLVTIPRKLAHIIHSLPKSVSPAVEAFYLRDPLSLQPAFSASAALAFSPEDLVTTSVRFSKVLFAQLKSQRFEPPTRWQTAVREAASSPEREDVDRKMARLESGMKLTCGFDLLAASANKKLGNENKRPLAQEIATMLQRTARFGDAALPTDEELRSWQDCHRDDDETWMDIDYEDFGRELDGKPATEKKSGFGNAQTQADLRKIVSRFDAFLNDESAGLDGAELDEADDGHSDDEKDGRESVDDEDSEFEDKVVSFNEQSFSRMMREMMGLPTTDLHAAVDSQGPGQAKTIEAETSAVEEPARIEELAHQMEAELRHHGALACGVSSDKSVTVKGNGQAIEPGRGQSVGVPTLDSHDEVDIDINLARNLLESFKSQAGMAGPTGNLLGMMGFRLPRDEDEHGYDDDGKGSPRTT